MAAKGQDFRALEGEVFRADQGLFTVFQKRHLQDYRNGWIYLWHPLIGGKKNDNREVGITINCEGL